MMTITITTIIMAVHCSTNHAGRWHRNNYRQGTQKPRQKVRQPLAAALFLLVMVYCCCSMAMVSVNALIIVPVGKGLLTSRNYYATGIINHNNSNNNNNNARLILTMKIKNERTRRAFSFAPLRSSSFVVDGQPSSPGWGLGGKLDRLTDWTENSNPNRAVMCEYDPSGLWLWTKWQGTIFKNTWKEIVVAMGLTLVVHICMTSVHPLTVRPHILARMSSLKKIWEHQVTLTTFILTFFTSQAFNYWQKVYQTTRMIQGRINDICMLVVVGAKRGSAGAGSEKHHTTSSSSSSSSSAATAAAVGNGKQQQKDSDRSINSISDGSAAATITDHDNNHKDYSSNASISSNAGEDEDTDRVKDGATNLDSSTTNNDDNDDNDNRRCMNDKADLMVLNVTRLLRVSHILFWAATPTASNGLNDCEHFMALQDEPTKKKNYSSSSSSSLPPFDDLHIGPILLSTYGLRALMESGQLTQQEIRDLMTSKLPPSQYAYVLLVWASLHITKGFDDGTIRSSPGMEENILRHITSLRGSMMSIDDMRAGRMPLAYVHLVQILVDSLVLVAPFALYPDIGCGSILSVPLIGLITLFYRGLLSISKSFLDPFGVEGFDEQNIRVDVLVSEINFGAGQRWYNAAKRFPV